MATEYIYSAHLVCPAGDAAALNAWMTLIGPEGDGEAGTFGGVALSANGKDPATHYGASGAFTVLMRAKLESLTDAGQVGGLSWWLVDAWSYELIAAHNGNGYAGQVWQWQDALNDLGLQAIVPEEI